jgi:hypothetical protein
VGAATLVALLVAAAAVVGVLVATSGGGSSSSTGSRRASQGSSHQARAGKGKASASATTSGSGSSPASGSASASAPSSGAASGSTSSGGSASVPSSASSRSAASGAGSTGAAGASQPVRAVESFYRLAAAHDYSAAWALADPAFRSQLNSYQDFAAGQQNVRSVSFDSARVINQTATTATVAVRTTSVHTDGAHQCSGTVEVGRSGPSAGWLLHQININCS